MAGLFLFLGRPRLAEVKSVKRGATLAALLGVIAGCALFAVPSRWHVLHLPLPRNSSQPAVSSAVSVALPVRNVSNLDENGLMALARSYAVIASA